jgi:RNA-binding protein YhbY
VQRCPNNPQEKRTQAQEKKLKPQTEKGNNGLNENGHEEIMKKLFMKEIKRKVPRDCLRELKKESSQGLFKGTKQLRTSSEEKI